MPIFDTAYTPKIRSNIAMRRQSAAASARSMLAGLAPASSSSNAAGPSPATSPTDAQRAMAFPSGSLRVAAPSGSSSAIPRRSAVRRPLSALPSPSRKGVAGGGGGMSSPRGNRRERDGNSSSHGGATRPNIEVSGFMRCMRAQRRVATPPSSSGSSSSSTSTSSSQSDSGDETDDEVDDAMVSAIQVALENEASLESEDTEHARSRRRRRRSRRASPTDAFPLSGFPTTVNASSLRDDDDLHSVTSTASVAGKKRPPSSMSAMARNQGLRTLSAAVGADMARRGTTQETPILLKPARGAVRMTVVLDLDETLVRLRDGRTYVRPFCTCLFETLKRIPQLEIVIWTCATDRYARDALQKIRGASWNHIISRDSRWYREDQPAVKNMAWLGRDLDRCIMIDNCPVAVSANPDNCIVVQDIPECLPAVDQTLHIVAEVIANVLASGLSVSEALNQEHRVLTAGFQISFGADGDGTTSDGNVDEFGTPGSTSSPQFIPSDEMVDSAGEFGGVVTPTSASAGHRVAKSTDFPPAMIVARCLAYSIPSVIATFGSLEQPAHRLGGTGGRGGQ